MKKDELARAVLAEKGGIAKTADFVAAGVSKPDLTELNRLGVIERIRHGFYQLRGETEGNTDLIRPIHIGTDMVE